MTFIQVKSAAEGDDVTSPEGSNYYAALMTDNTYRQRDLPQ